MPTRELREAVGVHVLRRLLITTLLIAPAAALVVLAFDAGGYYADATGVAGLAALGALAAWALLAPNALAGFGRSPAIVLALLVGFSGWTLLSGIWSHASGLALVEFDRMLLYVAVFAVFALAGRTGARARALIAILAGAALVVAVIGLAAWLLPHQLPVSASFDRRRMSYPTGYWNATGLLAGLGVVWSLHLASASREHWVLRVAGAGAIAPLVAVLGFAASRGALVATVAGVVVYVLATRSRGVAVGLLACVPIAAVSFLVVADTPDLATTVFSPAAIAQGQRAAEVLVLLTIVGATLRALLVVLDRRLATMYIPIPSRRTAFQVMTTGLVVVVAVAIAIGVPASLSHAYHQFADGPRANQPGEARLTSLSSDGRTAIWHVALKYGFAPDPLQGSGAGTFADLWNRYQPFPSYVLVASSLFIGTLGDLGLVGASLLFAALVAIVLALMRRARWPGAEGAAWAGLLGAATAWLVFAVVDWDWQIPACTIWLFAVGGLAVSRAVVSPPPVSDSETSGTGSNSKRSRLGVTWAVRIAIGAVAVALALVPRAIERSQRSLDRAIVDLQRDDCTGAESQAASSRDALSNQSVPYMVLAYCAARKGRNTAALGYASAAVRRDPENWEVYYTQGLVLAEAGKQPRAALRAAMLRNPLGSYVIEASTVLDHASARARRRIALGLPIPLAVSLCGGPTEADQVVSCGDPPLPTLGPGPPVVPGQP